MRIRQLAARQFDMDLQVQGTMCLAAGPSGSTAW